MTSHVVPDLYERQYIVNKGPSVMLHSPVTKKVIFHIIISELVSSVALLWFILQRHQENEQNQQYKKTQLLKQCQAHSGHKVYL